MSKTILVVDDQPGPRDFAAAVFESMGFTVLQAQDSDAALEILDKEHGRIAAVLTDMEMPPYMHGGELGREINLLYPSINVVYTSGLSKASLVRQEWLTEDAPFIPKGMLSVHEFRAEFSRLAKLASPS